LGSFPKNHINSPLYALEVVVVVKSNIEAIVPELTGSCQGVL